MPYVSDAQRRFFHSPGAAKAGISAKTVKEWDAASKGKKTPERKASGKLSESSRSCSQENLSHL